MVVIKNWLLGSWCRVWTSGREGWSRSQRSKCGCTKGKVSVFVFLLFCLRVGRGAGWGAVLHRLYHLTTNGNASESLQENDISLWLHR